MTSDFGSREEVAVRRLGGTRRPRRRAQDGLVHRAVGMAGISWLEVTQWRIAELRPPHLAAIAPWEGLTDLYRDMCRQGGIPYLGFVEMLVANAFGRNCVEDLVTMMMDASPLMSDYWRSKIARIEQIQVPAYVVASWSSPLHKRGTFEAFARLQTSEKWLRVHNTQEWPDHYAHEDDLRAFFDRYLTGQENGWESTPRVRMCLLNPVSSPNQGTHHLHTGGRFDSSLTYPVLR